MSTEKYMQRWRDCETLEEAITIAKHAEMEGFLDVSRNILEQAAARFNVAPEPAPEDDGETPEDPSVSDPDGDPGSDSGSDESLKDETTRAADLSSDPDEFDAHAQHGNDPDATFLSRADEDANDDEATTDDLDTSDSEEA